jgi:ribosomal protein S18 acetylase RimI-like enzyme
MSASPLRVRPAYPREIATLVEFNRALARETEGRELDLPRLRAGVEAVFTDPSRGVYHVALRGESPRENPPPAESPQDAAWQGAATRRIGGGMLGGAATQPRRILRSSQAAEDPLSGSAEVLGALLVTSEWSDWRNGVFWWIQSVYVVPSARRQGVFRQLYQHVLERARITPEVCGLRLYVDHENERAQAVYRQLGMQAARYRFFELDFVLAPEKTCSAKA